MALKINIQEKKEGIFQAELFGEINSDTYQGLEKEAKAVVAKATALIFDLKDVTYISSMGLSAIFRIKQEMEAKHGTIMLVNARPQIQTVFETVKVLPDHMFASLEDADEYLDAFLDGIQKGKIKPQSPKI